MVEQRQTNEPFTSNLITQISEESKFGSELEQKDPISFLERELQMRMTADQKDELRKEVSNIESYKEQVKKLLERLREQNQGNYKLLKKIDHLYPLYDAHDFWDSQPVPKAYENIDSSLFDKPIDREKTVEEVKQEPFNLPAGFVWSEIDIADRT